MSSCSLTTDGICALTSTDVITHDMVVYDVDYMDFADEYKKIGKELEKCLENYLKTIRGVSELCEGEFSDSLEAFGEIVEMLIKGGAKETMRGLGKEMEAYILALDKADGNWN